MGLLAITHLLTVMSPGPNQALVLSTSARNRRDGFIVAAGFWPAGCLWATMGLAGMGEVMRQVAWFELALRVVCGIYLVYLGIRMIGKAARPLAGQSREVPERSSAWRLFAMGFLTNLGNPKAIAYFASVFAATGAYVLPWQWQIVAIFVMPGIGFSWNAVVVLIVSSPPVRNFYQRFLHWIDRISGSVLVLFGLKLLSAR